MHGPHGALSGTGPSPRAEGPVVAAWAEVWSLGHGWLRSHPTRALRRIPLQTRILQDRLVAVPLGAAVSGWDSPRRARRLQCSMWPKGGSTILPQARAAAGLLEGPIQQGVCARVWEGGWSFVLRGSQWGLLLWLGLTEGVAHVGSNQSDRKIICILEASA